MPCKPQRNHLDQVRKVVSIVHRESANFIHTVNFKNEKIKVKQY